jgi:hypothetical protein
MYKNFQSLAFSKRLPVFFKNEKTKSGALGRFYYYIIIIIIIINCLLLSLSLSLFQWK